MTPVGPVPRTARMIVRVAAWVVPRPARAEWLEEWQSELWHETATNVSTREPTRVALGAIRDALAMRRLAAAGPSGRETGGGSTMLNEARLALRAFTRRPGFASMAVVTLALAMGASAALFTVIDSVLLRPLRYTDADRLVVIRHPVPGIGAVSWSMSPHGFMLFSERNTVFEEMGAHVGAEYNMALGGLPDRASAAIVSASLFRTLGARPAVGRLLADSDNAPGAPPVAVLGHAFWRRRFAGDRSIVGQVVRLDGSPVEVVGVVEGGFQLPRRTVDVWVPLTLNRAAQPMNAHFYETVARLRPGVTIESAEREAMQLASLFPTELAAAYGGSFVDDSGFSTELIPLRDDVVGPASTRLWVVFGAVGVVLLIACANVANLFLVRAESRRREVAVRNALGASRRALVRQFLAESMLIAIASGILAIVLAELGVRLLLAISPSGIPRLDEVEVRGPTILFTAFIALVSGYVFGLFPLLGGMRQAGPESLIDGTGRTTTGRARMQLRGALVIAQVALSLVLLAGAGLLLRSARSLWAMDAGFESAGLLTFQVSLPRVNYPDHLAIHRFHERLSTELRDLPGVVGVGAVTHLPMAGARTCFALGPVDGTRASDAVSPCTDIALISPGWLEAMEIPVRGRAFTAQDNENPTGGVLVTEALAAQFWPGVDPVGRRIQYSGLELTVTGVTGDIRQHGLAEPVVPQVFFPIVPPPAGSQWFAPASMTVVVRASHPDPATLLPGVRAGLARVDGEIPVASVRTMEQVVADSLADRSFILLMLAIAAILALALGTIGLYGVIAYVVAQRRAEIGIRIALGARPGAVGAMVVRQAMVLASAGVAIGIACALAGSRVLQSMLFAVSASDPLTIAAASALLLFVSAAAACGPARKASRIDPVEMMRSG